MNPLMKGLAIALLALSPWAQAASRTFPVKTAYGVMPTSFHVEVISDDQGLKPETSKNGRPFVTARPGEDYSVRIYNPLPVRVAVNLSVDGLNSISGKPSGIEDGQKWLIEPHGSVLIRGWQVSRNQSRRFFFTDKPKSYAQWRGDDLGLDLAANCGVIGAAYFWNQAELDRHYERRPVYRYPYHEHDALSKARREASGLSAPAQAPAAAESQQAGTGMGSREHHPTTMVDFRYDAGMYQASQAVLIYYDFASPKLLPDPFPALSYAPEMPRPAAGYR